ASRIPQWHALWRILIFADWLGENHMLLDLTELRGGDAMFGVCGSYSIVNVLTPCPIGDLPQTAHAEQLQ
ncbi:hypothetical protein KUCAC02_019263, partial [Chaenocephalus aceratus]